MRKTAAWKPKADKWNWRAFLTEEEAAFITASDAAHAKIEKLRNDYNKKYAGERQQIVNRALHRAKYEASK